MTHLVPTNLTILTTKMKNLLPQSVHALKLTASRIDAHNGN